MYKNIQDILNKNKNFDKTRKSVRDKKGLGESPFLFAQYLF